MCRRILVEGPRPWPRLDDRGGAGAGAGTLSVLEVAVAERSASPTCGTAQEAPALPEPGPASDRSMGRARRPAVSSGPIASTEPAAGRGSADDGAAGGGGGSLSMRSGEAAPGAGG